MAIFLTKWPVLVNICILDRSLPRSHTMYLPLFLITATLRGYHSWPSSRPLKKQTKFWKKNFFPTLIFCSLILSEMYPFYKLNICINQKRKSTLMCSLSEQVGGKVLMGSSPFQPFLEPILERLCIHDAFFLLSYPNFSSIFTPQVTSHNLGWHDDGIKHGCFMCFSIQ